MSSLRDSATSEKPTEPGMYLWWYYFEKNPRPRGLVEAFTDDDGNSFIKQENIPGDKISLNECNACLWFRVSD